MPQPFLVLIAVNLSLAGCLGWKWSLWPVPFWLALQRRKAVFFLTVFDSINDMKYFWNFCITPQPCHSHFCCWLLPIWPKLDIWAENGAYGLCRLGWRYNRANIYFYWPYMLVSMIWYKVRKKTAVLCCTANQDGTGHKLHFQPKHPAWAKLAAIRNKNGCGTAEVWFRHFGVISYNLY